MQSNNISKDSFCIEEDEIDLVELLRTIKKRKKIIFLVTGIFTIGAAIYVFLKTPLYEVKANLRIGFIGKELLEEPATLAKTLEAVYHVDEGSFKAKELNTTGAYIENIEIPKKVKNFLLIKTLGIDNEKAISKTKELVTFVQKEYKPKIDQYILNTTNEIERLKTKKENILKITIPNLKTQIKLINEMKIPQIDKKINLLKTQTIPQIKKQINIFKEQKIFEIEKNIEKLKNQELVKIEKKIEILKTQKIPQLQNKIEIYKTFKLKEIEEKIAFYSEKLKEYNKAIENLYKQFNKANDTKVMIASIQMVNYQNLVLDLQNKIKALELEKIKILKEIIPNLEDQIKNIKEVDIKNLEFAKNNILKIQIPKLHFQKENILNVEIPKLEFKLKNIKNIEIPKLLNEAQKIKLVEIKKINDKIISYRNEITQIDNKIKVLKYNISPANIQNSRVIGGFVTKDTPAKPKKRLILAVAFVTGLIFSIFLIFILEFWEENKKRLEESQ